MEKVKRSNDRFYIVGSAMADDRTRVLKQGDTFAVFDRSGDIDPLKPSPLGLYHDGTRFLSCSVLLIGDARPLLLSSTIKRDNGLLAVDLTNPDLPGEGAAEIPRGTLHMFRSTFLWNRSCYERLRVHNYGLEQTPVSVRFQLDADFSDLFEVRGQERKRRGKRLPEAVTPDCLVLSYQGLDNRVRRTTLRCSPQPAKISSSEISFEAVLKPKEELEVCMTISCETGRDQVETTGADLALQQAETARKTGRAKDCEISASNEQFGEWLKRSSADLHMLLTETSEGLYPYGGIPWFSTPFGRDGIITALQFLWVNPEVARGVLTFLASMQATDTIPQQDAEPGKILHESRHGEMAALGEIPFGRYYGSVDSTPLFVILAGAYYERTGDRPLIERLWPHIELALQWVDRDGDHDGDGFVEYSRRTPTGLIHQGWKDSKDAIFHADGLPADGPIALCEVQGYVYEAKRRAGELATLLGLDERARTLTQQAQQLREQFTRAFWCEDLSMFALALDGKKRPCRVRSSNAGHSLFSGIASPQQARGIAEALMTTECFSGWGIRTIASSELRYNPMSYHNGSVWPHDNALIAAGLAQYGFKQQVMKIFTGLFEASLFMDLHRMPELFCGFSSRHEQSPTLYPVACSPQAWAAASVFMLLQASLGLHIDAPRARLSFRDPQLPAFLQTLQIRNLRIGDASVDLSLTRQVHDVGINVLRREGQVEIVVTK